MENKNKIQVLGLGCPSCKVLLENVKKAVKDLDTEIEVEYSTEIDKIISLGVMQMPGLIINEKIINVDCWLEQEELKKIIKENII